MNTNTGVLQLTDSQFGDIISQNPLVLVDFWAPWCGPCVKLGPVIEQLASLYKGKAMICKLNIDDHAEISSTYFIKMLPTLLIFHQGLEVKRLVGKLPIAEIQMVLDRYLP